MTRLRDFLNAGVSPRPIEEIRELQAELVELRPQRSELAAELEHQVGAEPEEIIGRWEQAIENLRAEVEREIESKTRRFDLEKRQVTARLGRNRVVGELDRELDLIIEQKWEFFDEEAALKQAYMERELTELEIEKASRLHRFSMLIANVQSELNQKLERLGISLDQFRDQADEQNEILHREQTNTDSLLQPNDTSDEKAGNTAQMRFENSEEPDESLPLSSNDDEGNSRGFFFNSELGAIGDFGESLDPTTLPVLVILITLAATTVQLVKGN